MSFFHLRLITEYLFAVCIVTKNPYHFRDVNIADGLFNSVQEVFLFCLQIKKTENLLDMHIRTNHPTISKISRFCTSETKLNIHVCSFKALQVRVESNILKL